MNQSSNLTAVGNAKMFRVISYTLVFLMLASFVMTIGVLIRGGLPGWSSGIITGITVFILIDRLYTYERFKPLTLFSLDWVITLGSQWIVIVLFMRTLLSFANGPAAFIKDMSLFARGYVANFFSPEFVVTLLLAFFVWYVAGQFLELLDEIGLDQALAWREDSTPVRSDALSAHQRLANLIFRMGIVLVLLTALTRVNLSASFSNTIQASLADLNRFSGGEAGALLYFVFGLALLCLGRLMSLRTRWKQQHIPVASNNLVEQWGLYSFFFLLILIIVIGFLPSNGSFGFLSLLAMLLDFLIRALFFIAQLILILIYILFSIPFLLLGKTAPFANSLPVPPTLPNTPVGSVLPVTNSAVWALIRSIFLWGSLLVIIGFSVARFVKQRGGFLTALRKTPIANWLILVWQWLRSNADKTRVNLSHMLADGWQSIVSRLEGKRLLPRPGFISLRTLDPRRQIYFFYLAMIRRGGDRGVVRKPAQTPSEYAVKLENVLPSVNEDVDSITAAFVEARYSSHPINSRAADLVKVAWARVRRALQILD